MNKRKSKSFYKHTKQALAVILTLALMLSLAVLPATAIKSGDYEYGILTDETVNITGYNGSDSEITIPAEIDGRIVTRINGYAFSGSDKLTSVKIPENVKVIGYSAFSDCTALTSVELPSSMRSIDYSAFSGCTSLTSINIPDGVTEIGFEAFLDCTSLKEITIPGSVIYIDQRAFYNCTALEKLTIKEGVTGIDFSAFSSCKALASISVPDSVTVINSNAFYDTAWYNNHPNGMVYAGKVAYKYKGYMSQSQTIVLDDGTKGIADAAFINCPGLKDIVIPDSVTSIGSKAFYETAWYNSQPDGVVYAGKVAYAYKGEMPQNSKITLKYGTKGIAATAFKDVAALTEITIPDSVVNIGWEAFSGCTGLKGITVPGGVTHVGRHSIGLYYDKDTYMYLIIDGFIIYGYEGSAAEKYAVKNKIDFVALTEPVTVPGDATCDGVVTLTDAIIIQKTALLMRELSGQGRKNADVNGDGKITVIDAIMAQKISLKMDI